jgi:hypothetical protein
MERREIIGNVVATTLSVQLSNSATSISLTDGSTFPSGTSSQFVVAIDRGLINEEKILCSSRSTNTITVAQRGYDGTSAQAHNSGAVIDHVLDANAIQDMNMVTYDNQVLMWVGI